jgi:hypothetical protein
MAGEFFNWTFVGAPVSVDLSLGVLERLRRLMSRKENTDQTGILLGTAMADSPIRVRVTGLQPTPPNHFRTAIQECHKRGGASPVGYYRFSNRQIQFETDDLAVARNCFEDPGAVFLIGRANPNGEPTAGLFFWDEGKIHRDFSFLEFPVTAEALREPAVPADPRRKLTRGLVLVCLLAVLALAGLFVPWANLPSFWSGWQPLGLRYEARGSLVRVAWDKSLASIAGARRGKLSIREEGRETTVPLAGDQLRTGAIFYTRATDSQSVRFQLEATNSWSRSVRDELTAQLPPRNAAIPAPRRAGSADVPAAPGRATRPFEIPSSRQSEGEVQSESLELPTVSIAEASSTAPSLPADLIAIVPPPEPAPNPDPSPVVYVPAKPVHVVRPALPSNLAATVRTKTRVQLRVGIDRDGNVVSAEPFGGDALSRLIGNIVATAARTWRFEPARRDGVPVAGELVVNVDYEPSGK